MEIKEFKFYFNDSSEWSSKDSNCSSHESLSWQRNSDSHLENEQAYQIFQALRTDSCSIKKDLKKLFYKLIFWSFRDWIT